MTSEYNFSIKKPFIIRYYSPNLECIPGIPSGNHSSFVLLVKYPTHREYCYISLCMHSNRKNSSIFLGKSPRSPMLCASPTVVISGFCSRRRVTYFLPSTLPAGALKRTALLELLSVWSSAVFLHCSWTTKADCDVKAVFVLAPLLFASPETRGQEQPVICFNGRL